MYATHRRLETERLDLNIYLLAGYNPAYGARPLNRVVKAHVLDPMSRYILGGGVRNEEKVKVRLV
jgi:ATP-dependent Clp protease ATP-binding subunit ClpB